MKQRGILSGDLVMLVPCMLLLATLAAIVASRIAVLREHRNLYNDFALKSRLNEIYGLAFSDLDSHRFAIPPKIHPPGIITLHNGSLHPISFHQGNLRPQASSQALTSMRLAPHTSLLVLHCATQAAETIMEACYRHEIPSNPSENPHFLGLSSIGFSEWHASIDGNGSCLRLRMTNLNGMISSVLASEALCSVHVLIPIEALYSLYLDQTGNLRYLAHRGEETIENQPLIQGLASVTAQAHDLSPVAASMLTIEATISSGNRFALTYMNHLMRTPLDNFLFNP